MTLLDRALAYQELGWQVFPVIARGKVPLTAHGFKDASDLEEDARAWWAKYPNANIGVRTGEESGFWVLDIDRDKGGFDTLAALEHLHGPLTAPYANTGGGGRHYFFAWDSGLDIPSRSNVAPGLDVRGRGGYIVAPGSVHSSGAHYTCDHNLGALEQPPAWALELACGPTHATRTKQDPPLNGMPERQIVEIRSALQAFSSDERDVWLRVGMALHGTRTTVARELWDEWSSRSTKFDAVDQEKTWGAFTLGRQNDIGLGTLFDYAYKAGWAAPPPQEPKSAPSSSWDEPEWIWKTAPAQRLDVERAFPPTLSWMRDWILSIERVLQAPPEFMTLLALGMVSGAIAGRYEIALDGVEWSEPAPLWVLCAMPSGALKSPVFKVLSRPFYGHDLSVDQAREESDWEGKMMVARAVLENVQAKLKKQAGVGGIGPDMKALADLAAEAALGVRVVEDARPPKRDIVGSSFTTAGLVAHLQDHDERCLILDPEGSVFGHALAGARDVDRDLDPWLKSYSCEPIKQVRIGNGNGKANRHVKRPVLAIAACTQPENLSMFRDKYAEGRGFLARFIVAVFPYKLPDVAIVHETLPQAQVDRWAAEVTRLLQPGRPSEPIQVLLCDEGARMFEVWASKWLGEAKRDIEAEKDSSVAYASAFGAKLRGMALRLILTMHALEVQRPEESSPSPEVVRCVLDVLVPFIKNHVERLSSVIRDDPAIKMAERILRWLASESKLGEPKPSFSRTQAFNGLRTGLACVDDLNAGLAVLSDSGWIRPVGKPVPRAFGFQQAARRYDVHPELAAHLAKMSS